MNILRLSTLSLTLIVAVFAFGQTNPAFADKPGDGGHNHGDDPSGLTYTIDLIGPDGVRGAFEFDGAGGSATLDRGALKITGAVTMTRPGDATSQTDSCSIADADQLACMGWNDVFNLCGLLGTFDGGGPDDGSGPTNLNTFTVLSGDWSINQGGGRRWIGFGFAIDQSFSDATDRDLSASLQLTSPCSDPEEFPSCDSENDPPLIPTVSGEATYTDLNEARVHLRGKGGVTHQAECHADDDLLSTSFSTLVITAN